jgi:DnaJ like chaperone protein
MAIIYIVVIASAIGTESPILIGFSVILTLIFTGFIYQSKYNYDGHNSIKWILPILKLSAELIKIDGDVNEVEIKRVENYLKSEFTIKRAEKSINLFNEYLEKKINVWGVCKIINETNEMGEKMQILHFLIKLAASDKFLSNKEEQFIELIMKWMRIPLHRLKSILSLHSFIYENEYRNKKKQPRKPVFKRNKAYELLSVPMNSSIEEVKKAYRELAKIYHPDKVRDKKLKEKAKQQFQIITEAYETIKKEKG